MADNHSTSSEVLIADQVWLDGGFVPWKEGKVHVMTHALHYGLGVFEGIRAYPMADGRLAIFRLKDHVRRFFESAHIIQLALPFSQEQICEACIDLLRRQRDRFAKGAYLRPIAFMATGRWAWAPSIPPGSRSPPGTGARTWGRRACRKASAPRSPPSPACT